MQRTNYQRDKRLKDLEKQRKKAEKKQKKLERKGLPDSESPDQANEDGNASSTPQQD